MSDLNWERLMSNSDWNMIDVEVLVDPSYRDFHSEEEYRALVEKKLNEAVCRYLLRMIKENHRGVVISLDKESFCVNHSVPMPDGDYEQYHKRAMARDLVLCRECAYAPRPVDLAFHRYCARWRCMTAGANFCSWGVRREDDNENHD